MSWFREHPVLGLALVLAAGAGVWVSQRDGGEEPAIETRSSDRAEGTTGGAPGTEKKTAPRELRCRFETGDARAWDLSLNGFSRFNLRSLEVPGLQGHVPTEQRYDLRHTARMDWRVLGGDAKKGWDVAVWITDSASTLNNQPAEPPGKGYDVPFLVRVDALCQFTAMAFHDAVSAQAREAHKHLVLVTEVVLPERKESNAWTVRQLDDTGFFDAAYRVVGPGAHRDAAPLAVDMPVRLRRSRERYTTARPLGPGVRGDIEIARSQDDLDLAPDGRWLATAEVHHELVYRFEGEILAQKSVDLHVKPAKPREGDVWAAGLDRSKYTFADRQALEVGGAALPKKTRRQLPFEGMPEIEGLAGRSLESVLFEYRALVKAGDGRSVRHAQILLVQYLRANPERASALLAAIKAGQLDRTESAHAFYALESAGTPESKAALVDALRDAELGWGDRSRAATALADVPFPDTAIVEELAKASTWQPGDELDGALADFQNGATLALGALGGAAGEEFPDVAAAVKEKLLGRLEVAKDPLRLAAAIGASGNTGDASLWPNLAPNLDHENPHVRSATAIAAGQLQPDGIWPNLVAELGSETDSTVRLSLLKALLHAGEMPADQLAALVPLLATEEDPKVRVFLVKLLGSAAAHLEAAKAALVARLTEEKDPIVLVELGKFVDATKHL